MWILADRAWQSFIPYMVIELLDRRFQLGGSGQSLLRPISSQDGPEYNMSAWFTALFGLGCGGQGVQGVQINGKGCIHSLARVQIQGAVGSAQYAYDWNRYKDRWAVKGLTAGRNRIRDWKGKLHVLEARGRSLFQELAS